MKYFIVIAILFLSGCELKNAMPPIKYYTLSLVDIEKSTKKSKEIIKVSLPISDKVIMSNNILYDDGNYSLESYAFAKWVDTPNAMIQKILKEAIIDSNLFESVILDYSNLRPSLELETNIVEFKQIIEKDSSIGVVKFRCNLINLRDKNLIASKEFKYKVASNEANIAGAITSFNSATKTLAKELVEWLEVNII